MSLRSAERIREELLKTPSPENLKESYFELDIEVQGPQEDPQNDDNFQRMAEPKKSNMPVILVLFLLTLSGGIFYFIKYKN